MNKPSRDKFIMVGASCYELFVGPEGITTQKRVSMPIINLEHVGFIIDSGDPDKSIIEMSTGTRFLVKMNYEELKVRFERFIESI